MSAHAIVLRQIRREVSGGAVALADATTEINSGEFAAIIGPSGSGKTTLLSILGLLDQPTSGKYLLCGNDVSLLSENQRNYIRGRQLGFIFQNSYLVATETVLSHVELGLRVRGVPLKARNHIATDVLHRVGLGDAISKQAGSLSGGEKQRVAVARALATSARLILADEPTGSLDQAATQNLIDLLHTVNDAGTTVVVVTHDPLVAASASQTYPLHSGVLHPNEKSHDLFR